MQKPKIGVLSSMKVSGDVDMQTFQTVPAWMVIEQLEQLFEIEIVDPAATALPEDIDLLLVVHPKNLDAPLRFAIDQFLMRGGKMLAFLDPLAEMDRPAQANPMMPTPPQERSSDLNWLTSGWGVTLVDGKVLGDSQTALSVSGPDGAPMRHLAIVSMAVDNLSSEDVITANLESINLATAGIFEIQAIDSVVTTPIISSSEYAMPLDAMQFQFMSNPADLQLGFVPTGESYPVGVRISGAAKSAFPNGIEGYEGPLVSETSDLNVILIADTDVLTDRLWVQVQNFFGQRIASPWADNGDLVVNALDILSGSQALISIRSRGRFTRPFEVVQDLRREAEARFLESANDLQGRLAETEAKLSALQAGQEGEAVLGLSPEQEAELLSFQEEKLRIRKQLRDVRHQLDSDIDTLGSTLKFLNIALIPILLTLILMMANLVRVQGSRRAS